MNNLKMMPHSVLIPNIPTEYGRDLLSHIPPVLLYPTLFQVHPNVSREGSYVRSDPNCPGYVSYSTSYSLAPPHTKQVVLLFPSCVRKISSEKLVSCCKLQPRPTLWAVPSTFLGRIVFLMQEVLIRSTRSRFN
jgi:hypothetical protein